jgi:hypothetical protein
MTGWARVRAESGGGAPDRGRGRLGDGGVSESNDS